ncbi:hypothetical protein ACHAWF_008218 [Thalassiosira exigua]
MMFLPALRFVPLLKGGLESSARRCSLTSHSLNNVLTIEAHRSLQRDFDRVIFSRHSERCRCIRKFSRVDEMSDQQASELTMEKIYSEWSLEDDTLLYENKHLPTVRLASLLGRGTHGVESRLKKLTNVDSVAYGRLFASGNGKDDPETEPLKKLTPVKEVLRRIQWDLTLPSSSFSIVHYDRVEDSLCETPFEAPNDSISGKEERFVFALPEHRIEGVKYLERTVWDKEMRLDCVFGSMNGNGETIDQVIESYEEWKKEKEEREERNRRWQIEILKELNLILTEQKVDVLKDLSSRLVQSQWDTDQVKGYVQTVLSLYYEAKREKEDEFIEVVDFLGLFSDLVALLPNELLREDILKEIESVATRKLRENVPAAKTIDPVALPELKEDELEEKFAKGSGAGGQKINKTSNRVILVHTPTQVRVECQDTRSLQQNRKIARKRLRLKVDAFLNGDSSRASQKASVAVTKKAKNKARNKRRRQNKKKSDEML